MIIEIVFIALHIKTACNKNTALSTFSSLVVKSKFCFSEFSVAIGGFVMGLLVSQISSFFSL